MPQTIIDLGKKVKAKYPGQYDDLPDAEVGTRVKAKYPGAYDDFSDAKTPAYGAPATPQYADYGSTAKQVLAAPLDFFAGVERAVGLDPMHPFSKINLRPEQDPKPLTSLVEAVKSVVQAPVRAVKEAGQGIRTWDPQRFFQGLGAAYATVKPAAEAVQSGVKAGVNAVAETSAPEKLMSTAASARKLAMESSGLNADDAIHVALSPTKGTAIAAGKLAAKITLNPAASAAENLARWLAEKRAVDPGFASATFPDLEAPEAPIDTSRAPSVMKAAAADEVARSTQWRPASAELPAAEKLNIPRPGVPSWDEEVLQQFRNDLVPRLDTKPPVTPGDPLPFSMPETTAAALKDGQTPNLKAIEEAIAPSGTRAKLSTIRIAPKLAEEAPEIAGQPKGAKFDGALMDAFKRVEDNVATTENAIPRTTTVSQDLITENLAKLYQEYNDVGLTKLSSAIAKEWEKWASLPAEIPWETFRDMKRAFFKGGSLTGVPMRRAYGVLMDAAGRVSPDLAEANLSYSTVRRAIENAGIDIQTGRRIKDVGKVSPTAVRKALSVTQPRRPVKMGPL
jgi:hypothetical protein